MKYYIPPVIVNSQCSGPSTFIDFFLVAFGISAVIVLLVVAATLYVLNKFNL